jgi:hypothetical protein
MRKFRTGVAIAAPVMARIRYRVLKLHVLGWVLRRLRDRIADKHT